jgi:ATP-dependent Clp protease adaptor protein ClpS
MHDNCDPLRKGGNMNITLFPYAGTTTEPEEKTRAQVRLLPPYHVILENDDFHSFEFVIAVLVKTIACTTERAVQLTWKAHSEGRAVIWTGSKEVAEFKVEQIRTFHETRERDGLKLGPLSCCIEPAPGS